MLFFQRLFNNKISDEKFSLDLTKLSKRMLKIVELNPNTVDTPE